MRRWAFCSWISMLRSLIASNIGSNIVSMWCTRSLSRRRWPRCGVSDHVRGWSTTPLPAASAVAFSAKSPRLATGDDSGRVRVWRTDIYDDAPHELIGHAGAITAMDFSPDGALLAAASTDGTVRLWDIPRFGT